MTNPNSSQNPIAVITGASAGLGRALAHQYAKNGYYVALLARSKEALASAEKEVTAYGVKALAIPTDVSQAGQIDAAANQVAKHFGRVDVWVNCAMVSVFSPVIEMLPEEYERVTAVNYLGTVYGTLAALKIMKEQGSGTIVQVGSALSKRSIPLQSAYCATKHAINGFTESLRCELLAQKSAIRVVRVQLPAMNTPQFRWVKSRLPKKPQPVPPIFQPEVVADGIFWAGSEGKREVYLGFSTWKAIIAEKFLPGFADWYLSKTGFDSQQTDQNTEVGRTDNLFEPRPEKASMRGDFDDRALSFSFAMWLTKRQTIVGWFLFMLVIAIFWFGRASS